MNVSLSTSCLFHLSLRRVLRLAQETGYDGIELVLGLEAWLKGADKTVALVREFDLDILSIHQSLLPLTPAGSGDARMLDAARFAAEIGCPTVVIHGPWSAAWGEKASHLWLEMLDRTLCAIEGTGTRLALENVGVYQNKDRANVLASNDALLVFAPFAWSRYHAGCLPCGYIQPLSAGNGAMPGTLGRQCASFRYPRRPFCRQRMAARAGFASPTSWCRTTTLGPGHS